ncbi:hypothetical protein ACFS07_18460 [Undibacterium arcticum]
MEKLLLNFFACAVLAGVASRKIRSVLTKPIFPSCAWANVHTHKPTKAIYLETEADAVKDFKVVLRHSNVYLPVGGSEAGSDLKLEILLSVTQFCVQSLAITYL